MTGVQGEEGGGRCRYTPLGSAWARNEDTETFPTAIIAVHEELHITILSWHRLVFWNGLPFTHPATQHEGGVEAQRVVAALQGECYDLPHLQCHHTHDDIVRN